MILYVVATPIGNLDDLTLRARNVLRSVPLVFAEDTRRASILLQHIGAAARLVAYHRHTPPGRLQSLLEHLERQDAAIISDAGTPGVNDPGGTLVAAALARFDERLRVVPIPGPSAVMAAASVSGFPMDEFLSLGFPPHKKGRRTFFDKVAAVREAVIFYESPYRVQSAMSALAKLCPTRTAVVCRELTKQFETIYRGRVTEVASRLAAERPRGEYVVVLAPLNFIP